MSEKSATAYPLAWPVGFPRIPAQARRDGHFGPHSFSSQVGKLLGELRLLGASRVVVSTNVPLRKDGLPYANDRLIPDPGVAIYFTRRGRACSLACDKWRRLEHNIRALALTVEAMRGLERWGASDVLDRVFTGFAALPAPAGNSWHEVLGVAPGATISEAEERYRERILAAHPDRGGTHEDAARLNAAIAAARQEARP